MSGYFLIRKGESEKSEPHFFIELPVDIIAHPGDGKRVTGQYIYSLTGLNVVPWRSTVACEIMDEAAASPFIVTECFPIAKLKIGIPHGLDDGFDPFTIDPHDFDISMGMMGTFGSNERETSAWWLVKWAQLYGWGEFGWKEFNDWYNDLGGWPKEHDFRFWHLDQHEWKSSHGEFRESSGICLQPINEGKQYMYTHAFIWRCLWYVNRKELQQ